MSQSSAAAGTMRMSSLRLMRRAMTSRSSWVIDANEIDRVSASDMVGD